MASSLSATNQMFYFLAINFGHLRILGVMQRLAFSYGATALIALAIRHHRIPYLIVALLGGYTVLLLAGNGLAYNETNILSIVDRAVLGVNHTYKDMGIKPKGLLNSLDRKSVV